jgi:3-hydroxybutyryl-CoA dehydrogenase
MMGPGIALTLALGGVHATILSRTEANAEQGLAAAWTHLKLLEMHGLADTSKSAGFDASTEFDDTIARVDLVIESIPENMELKQMLFKRMDAISTPQAVLASNTSGLSITSIARDCQRPERTLTTHFYNPSHLMPLVEVVKGDRTSDGVAQSVIELLAACGKMAVLIKKDRPGQLGNRLQMALVREAVNIVAQGIADVEDVDLVARDGFGLRLPAYGIFEHQDITGLDLGFAVVDYVSGDLYNLPHAPPLYREKIAKGELGVKTGKGFYDWSKRDANEVRVRRDEFVLEMVKKRARTAKE